MLHFSRSYYQALLYLQLHLSFPSTPTLAKKKAFRTLLTQWILPHFRMLKYRGPVNLTFVKELFWKEPFFRVSYTKMLIFGREKLSGYKYIQLPGYKYIKRVPWWFSMFCSFDRNCLKSLEMIHTAGVFLRMRRATERRMNWLWSLVIRVLESITVICTGRTENKLDLLSTEKNDFAFCDRTAVIHKTRYYLS